MEISGLIVEASMFVNRVLCIYVCNSKEPPTDTH